jgi:rhodanese-related sulfurtransferase
MSIVRPLASVLACSLIVAACSPQAATPPPAGSVAPPASATVAVGAGVRVADAEDAVLQMAGRTLIDVRTPEEFAAGHLAGAVNIPVEADDFQVRLAELDPRQPALVYCRTGRRSAMAADLMAQAGFSDVIDAGGLDALVAAGAQTGA